MTIYVDSPEVCQRIRDLRKKSGISREDLCRRTGMSEELLGDIEHDRELDIPYEVMKALCTVFSLRVEEILHPEQYPLK